MPACSLPSSEACFPPILTTDACFRRTWGISGCLLTYDWRSADSGAIVLSRSTCLEVPVFGIRVRALAAAALLAAVATVVGVSATQHRAGRRSGVRGLAGAAARPHRRLRSGQLQRLRLRQGAVHRRRGAGDAAPGGAADGQLLPPGLVRAHLPAGDPDVRLERPASPATTPTRPGPTTRSPCSPSTTCAPSTPGRRTATRQRCRRPGRSPSTRPGTAGSPRPATSSSASTRTSTTTSGWRWRRPGSPARTAARRRPTTTTIDALLNSVTLPLVAELSARLDQSMDDTSLPLSLDAVATGKVMYPWREQAWRNAELLADVDAADQEPGRHARSTPTRSPRRRRTRPRWPTRLR